MPLADTADKREPSLSSIAEELYRKHGNIDGALPEMLETVTANAELTAMAIRQACRLALAQAQGNARSVAFHGGTARQRQAAKARATSPSRTDDTQAPEYHSRRVQALGKENLLNFPLWDGTPLRLAKKDKVQRAATTYLDRGQDEIVKGRWLSYIASGLRATERVGQRYQEADLKRLKDKAIKEMK